MLDSNGFVLAKKATVIDRRSLARVDYKFRPVEFLTADELMSLPAGDAFVFDAEVYWNFFYVAFKHLKTGKYVAVEQSPGCVLNTPVLMYMFYTFLLIGFNSKNFDLPIIGLAMKGATCEQLKIATNEIIKQEFRPWEIEKKYNFRTPAVNHIDLIEVAPLEASLKAYASRIHAPRLQDLPIDEDSILTEEDATIVRPYCCNDLDNTELLYLELSEQMRLRCEMSEMYSTDLRSKSDAQIAEAVICSEIGRVTGKVPKTPKTVKEFVQYKAPSVITFQTPALKRIVEQLESSSFYLDGLGQPVAPRWLDDLKIPIGNSVYTIGMGGIHSTEKKVSHFADADTMLCDIDVESYYPRIILNAGLYPAHIGAAFLKAYNGIVVARLEAKGKAKDAKKAGDKAAEKHWKKIADSLKITINGSFGKFGNKYSALYSPDLLLMTTITGQLLLLMLIEALELVGISVVSANTDGVIVKCATVRYSEVTAMVASWERHTSLKTEETRYKSVHNRDVNNYIAIKDDGEIKLKGYYANFGSALNSPLSKNPEAYICSIAVQEFLKAGTPLEKTIRENRDIRNFVSARYVKGGGVKGGVFLGKIVRWYYAENEPGYIAYSGSGNKVPKTDGARPAMDLPETFPEDINYDWYLKEARDALFDIGYKKPVAPQRLFS